MKSHPVDLELEHVLLHYFPEGSWRLMDMKGSGVNNTTRFIASGGERFVLRLYETHRDADKVEFEHEVLLRLVEAGLPFYTPVPMYTRSGHTCVRTEEGKLAALFRYVEGRPPELQDLNQLRQFGEAAALLSQALAGVRTEREAVYPPYYEIEHAHPRCSLVQLLELCTAPPEPFADVNQARLLADLAPAIASVKQELPELRCLPHQLIHGDLNASNALADDAGRICAILDFEFVTCDVRVMEAAVFVSDLIRSGESAEGSMRKIEAFLTGYRSVIELTPEEMRALPLLMLLRRLDVLIHFLGRFWDGIDDQTHVVRQIAGMHAMTRWLSQHESELRQALTRGSGR